MSEVNLIKSLEKLSGMGESELKDLRTASIEYLKLLGFTKHDEMMIAITSANIIEMINEFKEKIKDDIQKNMTKSVTDTMPAMARLLTKEY